MVNGMINYRHALEIMRSKDDDDQPIPFDIDFVQVDGTYRTEHGVILCGQKDEMFHKLLIDIRYPHGSHHDTKIRVPNIVMFNDKRVHF